MQTRYFNQLNATVSAIGLGCMGMSEFYGNSIDAQSLALLDTALASGITLFDTADTYGFGHNERLLGQFLARHPNEREKILIATKFGIVRHAGEYERRLDNSAGYIEQACAASLKRLGTDYIDLYYCHRRDHNTPLEEMMYALSNLVAQGKIRGIGLSEVSSDTVRRAHAIHPITAVQSEYSLWSREPEDELLTTCQELGITFVAYSPLGRAFLTGGFAADGLADDDFRHAIPRLQGDALAHNQRIVEEFSTLANAWGYSNAQLCLAWLLNKHPHVLPIVGTRREHYLQENIAATDIVLSRAQITALDDLFDPSHIAGARYPDAGWAGIEQN